MNLFSVFGCCHTSSSPFVLSVCQDLIIRSRQLVWRAVLRGFNLMFGKFNWAYVIQSTLLIFSAKVADEIRAWGSLLGFPFIILSLIISNLFFIGSCLLFESSDCKYSKYYRGTSYKRSFMWYFMDSSRSLYEIEWAHDFIMCWEYVCFGFGVWGLISPQDFGMQFAIAITEQPLGIVYFGRGFLFVRSRLRKNFLE